MRKGRRARLLLIGAGVLLAVGVGTWVWLSGDESPPADEDLRAPRRTVPDGENGFLVLSALFHTLDLPEGERKARDPLGEGWDREVAEAALARNAAALRGFEDSLHAPGFQMPEAFLQKPECRPFIEFTELLSIRIRVLFDRGSEKEAFEEALRLLDYGHRLEGAEGTFLLFAVGRGAKGKALHALKRMLVSTRLSRGELAAFLDRSDSFRLHEEGWREMVRSHYRLVCKSIEENPLTKNPGWLSRITWKPNRTKRMFAETARRILQEQPVLPEEAGHARWPPTNQVGRALYRLLSPHFERLGNYRQSRVFQSVPRVIFAFRCYREDRGDLPTSLDALVPGYLKEVPADRDGRRLRYFAKDRTLQVPGQPPAPLGF